MLTTASLENIPPDQNPLLTLIEDKIPWYRAVAKLSKVTF